MGGSIFDGQYFFFQPNARKTIMLSTKLNQLVLASANDIKSIISKVGDLSQLSDGDKNNLVAALNSLHVYSQTYLSNLISDSTPSATNAYSAQKIDATIAAAIQLIKLGAPEAFDSLKEIADWITSDQSNTANLLVGIEKTVRFDQTMALLDSQMINVGVTIGIDDIALPTRFPMLEAYSGNIPGGLFDNEIDQLRASVLGDVRFDLDDGIGNSGKLTIPLTAPRGEVIVYNDVAGIDVFRTTGGKYIQLAYSPNISPTAAEWTIDVWAVRNTSNIGMLFSQDRYGVNFDRCLYISGANKLKCMTSGTSSFFERVVPDGALFNNVGTLEKFSLFKKNGLCGIAYNDEVLGTAQQFFFTNNSNPLTFGVASWNNPSSPLDMDIVRVRYSEVSRFPV